MSVIQYKQATISDIPQIIELIRGSKSLSNEKGWKSFRFISDNLPQITGFYEHMGARAVDVLKLQSGDFPFMEYQLD